MRRAGWVATITLAMAGAAYALTAPPPKKAKPTVASAQIQAATAIQAARTPARTLLADARRRTRSAEPVAVPPVQDAFSRALWVPGKDKGVVFEVSAFVHSPLGEAFFACEGQPQRELKRFQETLEVDVRYDLDRMGITKRGSVLSGRFRSLRRRLESEDLTHTGQAIHFTMGHQKLTLWRDEIILFDQRDETATLARLEGTAPAGPGIVVGEGEVFRGVAPKKFLSSALFSGTRSLWRDKDLDFELEVSMVAAWPPVLNTRFVAARGDIDALAARLQEAEDQSRKHRRPLEGAAAQIFRRVLSDAVEIDFHLDPTVLARGFRCRLPKRG